MPVLNKAFSLLELLICFALVAILMTIVTPLYRHHWVEARRHQAEINLLDLAGRLEAYFSVHGTYEGVGFQDLDLNPDIASNQYQLKIDSVSQSDYLIAAVPRGTQADGDSGCGILRMDAVGRRFVSGSEGVDVCWPS